MSGLISQSIPRVVVGKATGHEVHCPELSGAAIARHLYDRRSISGRSFGRLETLAALNVHELDDLVLCPGRSGHQASRDNNEEKREESAISHFEAPLVELQDDRQLPPGQVLLASLSSKTAPTIHPFPLLGQWSPPQPRGEQDH
jgi:hypothetical protein